MSDVKLMFEVVSNKRTRILVKILKRLKEIEILFLLLRMYALDLYYIRFIDYY